MFRKHEDWVEAVVVVPVKGADDADADEVDVPLHLTFAECIVLPGQV